MLAGMKSMTEAWVIEPVCGATAAARGVPGFLQCGIASLVKGHPGREHVAFHDDYYYRWDDAGNGRREEKQ